MTLRTTDLSGTHASGTLQIAEAAVNELLSALTGTATTVTLHPDNVVRFAYGRFHAHAELPHTVETGPAPRVTVRLASVAIALVLKAIVREPFVAIRGRDVTIALAEIPALDRYRAWWRCLEDISLQTTAGSLRVAFVIAIRADDGSSDRAQVQASENKHA